MKEIKRTENYMSKRIIALTSVMLLIASLVGCGNNGGGAAGSLSNDYITIHQYKNLEIQRVDVPEVTDQMVDQIINTQLQQESTTEEVTDRPVQDGDSVNINFVGKVDDVPFDGGTADGVDLVIGSGTFIGPTDDYEGFEEQLIGHSIGDNFDIEIQFPEPYFNEDLAGVVATFNITINSISVVSTPELTDEWVQQVSEEATTVEQYREWVRNEQASRSQQSADAQMQSAVMRALLEQVELKQFPDGAIDNEITMMVNYYEGLAVEYEMDFAEFTQQFLGMDEEQFHETVATVAEDSVRERLAVELIAETEGLNLTEEEYQEKTAHFAELAGFENLDSYIELFGEDLIRSTILRMVVAEWLVEQANVVDEITTPETPDAGHVHDENCDHD